METPSPFLSSEIPVSHPRKAEVESAILAVLRAEAEWWECEVVVSVATQVWLVGLSCPSTGFQCGFRVPPPSQRADYLTQWLLRMTASAASRPDARPEPSAALPEATTWSRAPFPAYSERRASVDRAPYNGVERRRRAVTPSPSP